MTQAEETAPPAGEAQDRVYSEKKRIHTQASDISRVSLKSDFSRGQPPTFSSSRREDDDEAQTDTRHHQQTLTVKQTFVDFLKDQCSLEDHLQRVDHFQEFQETLKGTLRQTYLPLVEDLRTHRVNLTEDLQQTLVSDVFLGAGGRGSSPRTVLLSGEAGVGKSVLVHQCIVDWCEDKALQDVQVLCPLTVPQLNLLQNQSLSVQQLLEVFCPGLSRSGLSDPSHLRVLFVLDGLDRCKLKLDFSSRHKRRDALTPRPVEILLSDLLRGDLLPDARLWITSRPGVSLLPPTLVHRVTELRGFSRHQRDLYLLQNVRDEKVVARLLSCSALSDLCRLPLFCSIAARVSASGSRATPRQVCVHFLSYHMVKMQQDYGLHRGRVHGLVLGLSRVAREQQKNGRLVFSEEQLKVQGVEVKEALHSGVCTRVIGDDALFTFVHPTVQEFLAELFVRLNLQEKICSDSHRSINLLHCLNQIHQEEKDQNQNQNQNQDQDRDRDQDQDQDQDQDRDRDQDSDQRRHRSSRCGRRARCPGPKPGQMERVM